MSPRDSASRSYRRALGPGLVLSVLAHALLLGLGALAVPGWDHGETAAGDRADRYEASSLRVVDVRTSEARPADANGSARAAPSPRSVARAPAGVAAPAVRAPRPSVVAAEAVPVPSSVPSLRVDEGRERLTATELAALHPGSSDMPRPTSRAARRVSGEFRDVGDRFDAVGGTRRAAPAAGDCTVSPGTIVDRRFPEDITAGGT